MFILNGFNVLMFLMFPLFLNVVFIVSLLIFLPLLVAQVNDK